MGREAIINPGWPHWHRRIPDEQTALVDHRTGKKLNPFLYPVRSPRGALPAPDPHITFLATSLPPRASSSALSSKAWKRIRTQLPLSSQGPSCTYLSRQLWERLGWGQWWRGDVRSAAMRNMAGELTCPNETIVLMNLHWKGSWNFGCLTLPSEGAVRSRIRLPPRRAAAGGRSVKPVGLAELAPSVWVVCASD